MRQYEPQVDWPVDVAMSQLRGDEYFQACQHLAVKDLTDAGSLQAMYAVVWMFECRRTRVPFAEVKSWTVQRITDYFPDAPVEPEDPTATKSGDDAPPRPGDGDLADSHPVFGG